ncbi:hypothetical protein [Mycobacterium uberis]|uniref:hypothetical protein n=1 Tax=Mycobacterium uberis TaxID=2162698 RepID=UPI000E3089DE|nr:hypothetical protein [Mycobacterium uberis]
MGVGDSNADLILALSLLPPVVRKKFRTPLKIDDGTGACNRDWVLPYAPVALPCYKDTNPRFANNTCCSIREILADR